VPDPTRLLIVFYSRTGSTEGLAIAAAQSARDAGADVRLRRAREVVPRDAMTHAEGWAENADRQNALYPAPEQDDAEWADAILFGTPCYFGAMATEIKAFLDRLGPQWKKGALAGKVGGAFATAAWPHGGTEVVTLSLYAPMAHLGMVITPTGYTDEAMLEAAPPLRRLRHRRRGEPPAPRRGPRRHPTPGPAHGRHRRRPGLRGRDAEPAQGEVGKARALPWTRKGP